MLLAAIDFERSPRSSGSRCVAGVGVTILLFALVVLGGARSAEARRTGGDGARRGLRAALARARRSLVFAGVVVFGVTRHARRRASAPGYCDRPQRRGAGAPAAIENGGRSAVTTELAPITQRSPIVTPLVTTTLAPHQTLSPMPRRALGREALPRHRRVGVVEAVVAVGDEAAVGEHAVLADLDAARPRRPSRRGSGTCPRRSRIRPGAGAVSQTPGSSSTCSPSSSRPSRSISSTLPCTGQRQNARRRANSQWMRARFQGSELRSYQRHFCAHSLRSRSELHQWACRVP